MKTFAIIVAFGLLCVTKADLSPSLPLPIGFQDFAQEASWTGKGGYYGSLESFDSLLIRANQWLPVLVEYNCSYSLETLYVGRIGDTLYLSRDETKTSYKTTYPVIRIWFGCPTGISNMPSATVTDDTPIQYNGCDSLSCADVWKPLAVFVLVFLLATFSL